MGAQDILLALMRFGILGAVSAPFVVLFRRAGLPGGWPGAAIGAGILVGLLAGPAGLWKTAPDWWRRDPGPDAAAVEALARQQSLDGAEVAALQATGVSPEGVLEHDAALHRRRQPLADLVQASSESRFRALRAAEGAALLLFAGPMILLGAGAGLAHSHGKSASGTLGNGKGRGMGIGMGTGMVIGCFALVFGALLNALLLALVLHFTPRQALAIGAALAGDRRGLPCPRVGPMPTRFALGPRRGWRPRWPGACSECSPPRASITGGCA